MVESVYYRVSLAAVLRKERMARNLSQRQVYLDTCINIARIESGKRSIEVWTFLVLCDYYKVEACNLLKCIESDLRKNYPTELWKNRTPKMKRVKESA